MILGILGAMKEEVDLIKNLMHIEKQTELANRTYFQGTIGNLKVVLTFSRWGKVASASTTSTLINVFNVSYILFTRVAGGIQPDVKIGDIVIGSGLYQHDMDARPFFEKFQIPLTQNKIFKPNPFCVQIALKSSQLFTQKVEAFIDKELFDSFSLDKPNTHVGLIASGDKFISSKNSLKEIIYDDKEQRTLAVEMEGAAVAQVCAEHEIPYLIIRVISDNADQASVSDFEKFIHSISSKYLCAIVKNFIELRFSFALEKADAVFSNN